MDMGRISPIRPMSMLEVVCGIIKNPSGKILACRRGLERHLGGLWEFPGGKVDAGETAEAAVARELHEELGITVRVVKPLTATVEWTDGAVSIRLRGFFCEIIEGEPHAHEHEEVRWCALSELQDLDWAEADVPLVEELLED
jgi:8-oxo-dGTP diphosphatase